ncbi:MAG: hypothetical protein E6K94_04865 [Thaumarchaeota archaeon]|nr:MAG: hypothetical protein E6K94_04865 [Nitrososphaerota archaeon]
MKFERMLFFVLFGMTLAVMMYFGMESNNIFAITIKIESPLSNQQVPVGELTITGTSSDNSTSECQVYVDWNSLKPYQLATPTGTNGSTDFSKWSYTYSSKYHLIQTGLNDLTSKITCLVPPTGPTVTKWYSINVTGSTSTNQSNIVQLPLPTANNNSPPSSNILTSTPQLDTSINTTNSSSSNQINLDISVEQNPIPAGEKQRVTLTASDPATGNTLDRVFLRLTIKDPSGNILKDYTDNDGELSPTFKINKDVTGTYSILASASQAGVETSKSSTFVVQ